MKNSVTTIIALLMITSIFAQNVPESRTKTIVASYDGSATNTYFFTNNVNSSELKFTEIDEEASAKYNLDNANLYGEVFRVTYRISFEKKNIVKKEGKLGANQNPFVKKLTILDLELLEGFKDAEDDDGGE